MTFKWFSVRIAIGIVVLAIVYSFMPNKTFALATLLHIAQISLPIYCAFLLFRSSGRKFELTDRSRKCFAVSLLILASTDIAYYVLLHFLKMDGHNNIIEALTTLPYYVSYGVAIAGFSNSMNREHLSALVKNKIFWIAPCLSVVLSIPFVILPMVKAMAAVPLTGWGLLQCISVPGALAIINVAFYVIICSQNIVWATLATGFFAMGVTDWGIQVEHFNRTEAVLSLNTFLWTLSGFLICLPFLNSESRFRKLSTYNSRSLVSNIRFQGIVALFVPLAFLGYTINSSWYGVVLISFGFVFGAIAVVLVSQYLLERIIDLGIVLENLSTEGFSSLAVQSRIHDLPVELKEQVVSAIACRVNEEREKSRGVMEHAKEIASIYSQVSHDIRSPLTALDVVLADVTALPEETRVLVRSATQRIRDIANSLLKRTMVKHEPMELSTEIVSSLIDQIVSEKRIQFRAKMDIEIVSKLAADSYGIFARINSVELKRLISNLINNSVEAMTTRGRIVVGLVAEGRNLVISVSDNGAGIPPKIMEKLGESGFSHGKEGMESGSGIGLYHAKSTLAKWGGTLKIHSQLDKGTVVEMILPLAESPSWFVPSIKIDALSEVVVFDDDPSIHSIWKDRLRSLSESVPCRLHHFSDGQSFKEFEQNRGKQKVLFLLDYELIGENKTGLDWAEELSLEKQSILVTNRYEEKGILKICQRLGIGIIPKSLAAWVPVEIEA